MQIKTTLTRDLDKKKDESEKKRKKAMTRTGNPIQIKDLRLPKNIHPEKIIGNIDRNDSMHIWTLDKWTKIYSLSDQHRTGVRIRFDKNVDTEVKRSCKEFIAWLRKQYFFPQRVLIYIKATEKIKAVDGDLVSATCLLPFDKKMEPYIRVSTGTYYELKERKGQDNALATILHSIAHELTHYYQWVNDISLTEVGMERQAKAYAGFIIDEYSQTREHP